MIPSRKLTHQEWAERFVKHATGPYKGARFRVRRQPFMGLLFRELDAERWSAIYACGPSQSGKTLSCFVIPALRTAVELKEDALIGVPEADMASDKWDKDFLPTLQASDELSWLIPTKGPGSKGGRIKDRVTLNNGVDLKIMSRGGQDTNKAGYTAQRICVTEAKGWSGKSESSTEADDLRKLIARQRAFKREDRRLLVEGTVGEPWELPWTARGGDDPDDPLISTRSRIVSPCPHCEAWICPDREQLVGWRDARTEDEVLELACFVCPACGLAIDDEARRTSLADCRLLHSGQSIDRSGRVIGDDPPTSTLWFHWNAWHNCLLNASDTAVDEWKASHLDEGTEERDNADRELSQFCWARAYESSLTKNEALNANKVRKRGRDLPRGLLPADTLFWTIGVDMGRWTGWWFATAFRRCGELHVPAYGAFDVCRHGQDDDESSRVKASLAEFAEGVVHIGLPMDGSSGLLLPRGVLVDMGYLPDDVAEFVRGQGRGFDENIWKCGRGRGLSVKRNNGTYHHPSKKTQQRPKIGVQWFAEWNFERAVPEITFNADHWLKHLQDRLRIAPGKKGAMSFYRPDTPKEHAKLSNHLCAEKFVREFDPEKGGVVEKHLCNGDNHWGDAGKMSLVLGDWFGFSLSEIPDPPPEPEPEVEDLRSWYASRAAA